MVHVSLIKGKHCRKEGPKGTSMREESLDRKDAGKRRMAAVLREEKTQSHESDIERYRIESLGVF
jgi:hypothetical protein